MRSIAFFVKTFEGGGAQRVMATLARQFILENHQVSIVTMFHAESYSLPSEVEMFNLEIDRNDLSIEHNAKKIEKAFLFLKKRNVDTVIIGSTSAPLYKYALEIRKKHEFRIIAQMTNDPNQSPRTQKLRDERDVVFEELNNVHSGFVFQTPFERDYFGPEIAKRSVIINNPIMDFAYCPYKGKRRRAIVAAGRLDEQKNFSLLLRAFALFCDVVPDYRLEIYGRGHMETILRNEAETLRIADKVDFCGFQLDWQKNLVDCSMFVQSSDYEGVSNVLLEALCLGVPTISTDCPAYGARMFAEDGQSILLVPVGDEKKLSDAMIKLANEPSLSKRMSELSVKICDGLRVENIARQYFRYFDELDRC